MKLNLLYGLNVLNDQQPSNAASWNVKEKVKLRDFYLAIEAAFLNEDKVLLEGLNKLFR